MGARCGTQDDCSWREVVQGGEVRWQLSVAGCDWEIQAQVKLGSKQGITVASKPDFVIRRVNGGPNDKPIAVFCDGFAYHGCPGTPEGRIWDDVVKRQSLIDSGKFQKWSVAWKDVELFEKGRGSAPTVFEGVASRQLNALARAAGLTLSRELGKASNMEMLWEYLKQPDPDQWRRLANVWSVAWLASDPLMDSEQIGPIEEQLLSDEVLSRPAQVNLVVSPGELIGRVDWGEYRQMLISCVSSDLKEENIDAAKVLLRLDDSAHNRAENDFESSWRAFLQAWNLLQFRENVEIQTSERIKFGGDELVELDAQIRRVAEEVSEDRPHLAELLEYSTESVKSFLHDFASTALTLPTLDFELDVGTERCGPEPELSWPELKVAILADNQLEDRPVFENHDWKVFVHPLDIDAVTHEIRLRTADAVNQEQ